MAEAGAGIVVLGRNTAKSELAAQELRERNKAKVLVITADVSREEDVNRAVALSLAHFGRIDILFNNAGINIRKQPQDLSLEEWDHVLKVLEEGRKGPVRDPENYFFTIFGEPAQDGVWGWRFEGHHLEFNFTAAKGEVLSATPAFFGSNPGEVLDGPQKGQRVLAAEEEIAWKLVRSLPEEQKKVAIINATAPKDVINGRLLALAFRFCFKGNANSDWIRWPKAPPRGRCRRTFRFTGSRSRC